MVVEFSVKNFRSLKDLQTISFLATKLSSNKEKYPFVDDTNIVLESDIKILKTIGIYGPNASGKSNILRALEYFIQAIRNEASTESKLSNLCDPFLYQEDPENSDCFFQIILILFGKKFRYGFTVKKSTNQENFGKGVITSEWLMGTKESNMGEYFIRNGMDLEKDKLPNSDKIPQLQYEHTLFLTHAAAFDREGVCAIIKDFFMKRTISNFSSGYDSFRWNTLQVIENENKKEYFLKTLTSFNINYDDVLIERDEDSKSQITVPKNKIFFFKRFINNSNVEKDIKLNLGNSESEGTQKLFDLLGTLIRGFTMPVSGLMILDEIDSNFHPALLIKVINLFNDPKFNLNNTQLIFTSHDTNLMSPSIMRRDQFYFSEKDSNDATRVYSLADLKGIRNDADFAKQYLAGFFGALPVLEDLSNDNYLTNDTTLEP